MRSNPLYADPELFLEALRIIEKLTKLDLKTVSPIKLGKVIHKEWAQDSQTGESYTLLKLIATNLGLKSDQFRKMLVHPDILLLVEELEYFTKSIWYPKTAPIPKKWYEKGPASKRSKYEPRSLLDTFGYRYSQNWTTDDWIKAMNNIHLAMKYYEYDIPNKKIESNEAELYKDTQLKKRQIVRDSISEPFISKERLYTTSDISQIIFGLMKKVITSSTKDIDIDETIKYLDKLGIFQEKEISRKEKRDLARYYLATLKTRGYLRFMGIPRARSVKGETGRASGLLYKDTGKRKPIRARNGEVYKFY